MILSSNNLDTLFNLDVNYGQAGSRGVGEGTILKRATMTEGVADFRPAHETV